MSEDLLTRFLKPLSHKPSPNPIGWFRWTHDAFLTRDASYVRSIEDRPYLPSKPGIKEVAPYIDKLAIRNPKLFKELTQMVERHAWTFGRDAFGTAVVASWKKLSPEARAMALAGASENLRFGRRDQQDNECANWIKGRLNDSEMIKFDPPSATQLCCNLTWNNQDGLIRMVLESVEDWGQATVARCNHRGESLEKRSEISRLSWVAIDRCLEASVLTNNASAARLFLEAGANPDISIFQGERSYNEGHCALSYSIGYQEWRKDQAEQIPPVWDILLDAGASPTGTKYSGLNKPLYLALKTGRQELADQLLDRGASFTGGEGRRESRGEESLLIRPSSYRHSGNEDQIERAGRRFGKLVKLSATGDLSLFYNGDCIGGSYATYFGAIRSIKDLKHFEQRGMPLTLSASDILSDPYPYELCRYVLGKLGVEGDLMYHFRRIHPSGGTSCMQHLCRPELNGSNIAQSFIPSQHSPLELPDGSRYWVDLDSIAGPEHGLGPAREGEFFVRKVSANYRRRENHLITRGLKLEWEQHPVPKESTGIFHRQMLQAIRSLLPMVKEIEGQFIWLGKNLGTFNNLHWPSQWQEKVNEWTDEEGKKIVELAIERILKQDRANKHFTPEGFD